MPKSGCLNIKCYNLFIEMIIEDDRTINYF